MVKFLLDVAFLLDIASVGPKIFSSLAVDDQCSTFGLQFNIVHRHTAGSKVWSRHPRSFALCCTPETLRVFVHCIAILSWPDFSPLFSLEPTGNLPNVMVGGTGSLALHTSYLTKIASLLHLPDQLRRVLWIVKTWCSWPRIACIVLLDAVPVSQKCPTYSSSMRSTN